MAKAPTQEPDKLLRTPLTRERIADEALKLIDEVGLEGCSMRRLGARLGVEAMAMYHYFQGKGDLLDAVMDRMIQETVLPSRDVMPPLEGLRQFMRNYRGVAIRHPRAFILLAARRFNTESAFELYDRVLHTFADLGLDAAQTARWFRLIGGFASGAGMAEVASRELVDDATRLRLQHSPTNIAYRYVRGVAPHLSVNNLEAVFEDNLDILFKTLEAQIAKKGGGESECC